MRICNVNSFLFLLLICSSFLVFDLNRDCYIYGMYNVLFFAIIGIFCGLLVLNIFFRVKVFKYYKYLVQNRVEFGFSHFFNDEKMQTEVLDRYPQHNEQILAFVGLIRRSITMASIMIVVITMFGYLLTQFR
ncbi:MAG: hypothetical protein ACJA01_001716 [Saprospiraceae bacterium]|jgi:hypothetical protein